MRLQLPISIPPLPQLIRYTDKILLIGSCFTEHIAGRLAAHKFRTLQNPHGILFNPLSVADALKSYVAGKQYAEEELFFLNELWGSWAHHTRFSHTDPSAALEGINASQKEAAAFIKDCDWVIITLGSAFQYFLKESNRPVANNHRAPAAWFEKRLLDIPQIIAALHEAIEAIAQHNPKVQFLFTISPVRHIRDGVVDNNRSKARLIEAVHEICQSLPRCFYFPAYELVIDVLRDYRFYDIDLVHPNYAATEFVWEAFVQYCITPEAVPVMEQVAEIVTAMKHRPRFPQTEAHKNFLKAYAEKTAALASAYPFLNLADEAAYFSAEC
jgi:hypothetical protein